MKQVIINVILGLLAIALGAVAVWLFFVNHTQKEEIEALKERLTYEEQMVEEMKLTVEETERQLELLKQQPALEVTSEDSEKEKPTEEPKEESVKKTKNKKVDLSDMETVEAQTIISIGDIDQANLDQYFKSYAISDTLFERIYGDERSYKTNCTVPREALSYLKVLHYDYEGKIRVGEMIVNVNLVDDLLYIFKTLFENQYQIEKMILVEEYGADDDTSVNDNNSSCFNFRTATDASTLSNHATGCAVDINPLQNPYFRVYADGSYDWDNTDADKYWDRTNDPEGRHMINYDDLCYKLFKERGFSWGGDWSNPIDYQHFEKPVY